MPKSARPDPVKQQDVVGLEVSMHDPTIDASQCIGDVGEHNQRRPNRQGTGGLELLPEGSLGHGHDQDPVVLRLARVDDRDDVADVSQLDEEQLTLSAGHLGYKLGRRFSSIFRLGDEDLSKGTFT